LGLFRFGSRVEMEPPDQGRQCEEQAEVGDVIRPGVDDDFLRRPFLREKHADKDEVTQSGKIGHKERAQNGALDPAM